MPFLRIRVRIQFVGHREPCEADFMGLQRDDVGDDAEDACSNEKECDCKSG